MYYDVRYFSGQLGQGACNVKWATGKMTRCAGVCAHSALGGTEIRLSQQLLSLRPMAELKDTLLHEMIHAELFRTGEWRRDGDHGPRFRAHMHRINGDKGEDPARPFPRGYRLSVYHELHAEVDLYLVHHWRCKRCAKTVKRAMNRAPQPADCRSYKKPPAGTAVPDRPCGDHSCGHHRHLRECGGEFEKVREPKGLKAAKKKGATTGDATDERPWAGAGNRVARGSGAGPSGANAAGVGSAGLAKPRGIERYFGSPRGGERPAGLSPEPKGAAKGRRRPRPADGAECTTADGADVILVCSQPVEEIIVVEDTEDSDQDGGGYRYDDDSPVPSVGVVGAGADAAGAGLGTDAAGAADDVKEVARAPPPITGVAPARESDRDRRRRLAADAAERRAIGPGGPARGG